MKFQKFINENVKDLDSTVRKLIKQVGLPAAKYSTTAIRGYNTVKSPGINTKYDVYDIRIEYYAAGSRYKENVEKLKELLTSNGIKFEDKYNSITINRKENSGGVDVSSGLSPEAVEELKSLTLIFLKNPTTFDEKQKKVYDELRAKKYIEAKFKKDFITKKQEYKIFLTTLGEKVRHLLT